MSEKLSGQVVGCMPVGHGKPSVKSVVRPCKLCDGPVWVSMNLLGFMKERPDLQIVCIPCLLIHLPARIDLREIPGQREEIEADGTDYDALIESVGRILRRFMPRGAP